MIYPSFFAYLLGTPISRNISYLVAASESIVSNILIIKKTNKIFSFSQKHVARDRKFLSENLKTKGKLENIKARSVLKNFQKISLFTFIFIFY